MKAVTYKDVTIEQKGEFPSAGDKVLNTVNAEIEIDGADGKKYYFEVRDGLITREMKGVKPEIAIIAIIFAAMMILMIYLMWLWFA